MLHDGTFIGNEERELRTYALSLPNGPAGFEAILQPASNPVSAGIMGPLHGHPLSGLCECDWAAASPNGGVERVTLDLKTADPGGDSTFTIRRHSVVLTFTAAPQGFDAYFLPWDGRGGVVWMTLAAAGPGHFFTAALSGCSVMVRGPANNPTVYHFGVDVWDSSAYTRAPHNHPAPASNVTPSLWVDLMEHLNPPPAAFTAVDKTEYVNDFDPNERLTTASSRAMQLTLRHNKGDANAQALPWGAVCGVRNPAGNWSFYLQENATLRWGLGSARRFFARHLPGSLRIATERSMCRPMALNRFFNVPAMLPRLWNL